jgi:nitroreductase
MLSEKRRAKTAHAVHELIARRYSPYLFSAQQVGDEDLRSLFEAARWAASSYNEQPWGFIVARRADREDHSRVLSCLVEANQAWASAAPVLGLGTARSSFSRNGKPNPVALHDLGLAIANLTFEAAARGLGVHPMAGILPDRARELFAVPPEHQIAVGLAIGYPGDPDAMEAVESLKERDRAARQRRALAESVFTGRFGEGARFLGR